MTFTAAADHPPAREPRTFDARQSRGIGHADPGAQKVLARRRKDAAVVGAQRGEIDVGQRDDRFCAGVGGARYMARRCRRRTLRHASTKPDLR